MLPFDFGAAPVPAPQCSLMQLSLPSMDVDVINLFLISESPAKKKKLDTALESIVGTDSLPRISNRIKKKTSKAKATHFLNELDESEWLSDNETKGGVRNDIYS